MTVSYKNIEVKPLDGHVGMSHAFKDGKSIGIVEGSFIGISFDAYCYTDSSAFENAAHFVWTLIYADTWPDTITDIFEDPVTDAHRLKFQGIYNDTN